MRAGDADPVQAGGDPEHRRDPPEPRRGELRRHDPRGERPRPRVEGDLPGARLDPRPGVPATERRPDRRHGRRDLGELEAHRRPDDRVRPGFDHALPDGTALQHGVLEGQTTRRRGRAGLCRLAHEAGMARLRLRAVRARRLRALERLHDDAPRPGLQVRLRSGSLERRGHDPDRGVFVRPHGRRSHAEPRPLGRLSCGGRRGRSCHAPGVRHEPPGAPDPRAHPAVEAGLARARRLRAQVRRRCRGGLRWRLRQSGRAGTGHDRPGAGRTQRRRRPAR